MTDINTPASGPATEPPEFGDFRNAAAALGDGVSTVVVAEAPDGSASQLVDILPEDVDVTSRVVCASACRATVGGVAEDLGLDDFHGGAIVLDDAQWADPTSLGRLQRLVKDAEHPLLLVLAHRPLEGVDGWGLGRLATAAERHGNLLEVALDADEQDTPAPDLEPKEVDLVVATGLLASPLPVSAAAQILSIDESTTLELGDGLVARGLLGQTRAGFVTVVGSAHVGAGEARIGHIAGRLSEVMAGMDAADAIVGGLRSAAGQFDQAFPLLASAAFAAEERHAPGEAFHLAEEALAAAEEAGTVDDEEVGRLHLLCGTFLRAAGRTEWAVEHLEKATYRLEGAERVQALRLAAIVEDDQQHPQDAERIASLAELEASRLEDWATLGSLLTLRARTLNRIGFADEADSALRKSIALLEANESEQQLFRARVNEAWIHFDRGQAVEAEASFTRLSDQARTLEGEASVADKEAWRARAMFAAGHPEGALEAVETAQEIGLAKDVEAPLFLAQLALTEGNLAYGRYEEALAEAERALDLVERQLPAWENMARSLVATAYLRLGRIEEAKSQIGRALAASPAGANGWRWRTRCQALEMEINTAGGAAWPEAEAEDLYDLMLQSEFYGWAAELLCVIAENGKRKNAASEALAIATFAGQPMIGARAANAGGLWSDPAAAHTILAVRAISKELPEEWAEGFNSLPAVGAALSAPEPADPEEIATATAAMDEALERAGLAESAGPVLSPAQRRNQGLVYRPRRFGPLRVLAAALGVVVLAGGTAFAVSEFTGDEGTDTSVPVASATTVPTTVPQPPSLQETVIIPPGAVDTGTATDDFLSGSSSHRGGFSRTGVIDQQGPRQVNGYYWTFPTAGPIETGPITEGQYVYVGSTEGTFYALDQTDGSRFWDLTPEGDIRSAPAIGRVDVGEGTPPQVIVVANDDGIVQGHHATSDRLPPEPWSTKVGDRVRSAPVMVGEQAVVATTDGFLHGLNLFTGEVAWTYPSEGEGLGVITADLAYEGDFVYAGTEDGDLHVFDMTTGEPIPQCDEPFNRGSGKAVIPIISNGRVYLPTSGNTIWSFDAGTCGDSMEFITTEDSIVLAPAIADDVIYFVQGRYLYALDMTTNTSVWENGSVATPSGFQISSPPVVAGDVVYFASEEGVVYAVDSNSGEELWTWSTGQDVRGAVAVGEHAVFITSVDGNVYAIGFGAIAADYED